MIKQKILIFLICVLLVLPLSSSASALFEPPYDKPRFYAKIDYPTEGNTITTDSVTVQFSLKNSGLYAMVNSMQVSVYLDGGLRNQVLYTMTSTGELTFTGLTKGTHTVEIRIHLTAQGILGDPGEVDATPASVNFYSDVNVAPKISIASLDEYKTNQATLNITTNVGGSIVFYSLDGRTNVTLPFQEGYQYSVTLSNLANGMHNFTVYSRKIFSNTAISEKIFTINAPISQSTNQPAQKPQHVSTTTIISEATITVTITACSVALLFYRKQKTKKHKNIEGVALG